MAAFPPSVAPWTMSGIFISPCRGLRPRPWAHAYGGALSSPRPGGAEGERGHILDLGCGAGEPIARYFLDAGCEVTGVDAAPAMIAIARSRFPLRVDRVRHAHAGARQKIRCDVAWDSFFHLRRTSNAPCSRSFADHIAPRGLLLFTSGPGEGEAIGELWGEPSITRAWMQPNTRALRRTRLRGLLFIRWKIPIAAGIRCGSRGPRSEVRKVNSAIGS